MGRGDLRLMWYNVENLFFPGDDSIPADDDFTPEGVRRWTYFRYRSKLTALARVIVAAGEWEPPDVVGLCEVEEATVLEDLVQHPVLEAYNYSFIHKQSKDHRGMDVACLYRENRVDVVEWSGHTPELSMARDGTRDILNLCFAWGKSDTLDLFLVHFISKYGGAGATAPLRKNQAQWLLSLVDSVHAIRRGALKVLAGDFNDSFQSYSLEPLRRGRIGGDSLKSVSLTGGEGSYKYRGRWSQIDQYLMGGPFGKYRVEGSVLNLWPLMTADEVYGGVKPARTYEGYRYAGGISDHLPILLDISRRSLIRPER
jgi:endonuclease/exonuclease/phosphatase family metal-dependent hydrolase